MPQASPLRGAHQAPAGVRRIVKRRIPQEVFDHVVRPYLWRLDPLRLEAVRRVMVDGMLWKEVAATPGVAASALSKAVSKGWKVVDDAEQTAASASVDVAPAADLPAGWVNLHIQAPASLVSEIRNLIEQRTAELQAAHRRRLDALSYAVDPDQKD